MDIKYKIIELWPKDHLIVVRYYSEEFTELELMSSPQLKEDGTPVRCRTDVSISIPIPEPSKDELRNIIMRNCPLKFFETQKKIKDPLIDTTMPLCNELFEIEDIISTEEILELLSPPPPIKVEPVEKELSFDEIKQLIEKIDDNPSESE